MKKIFYFLSIMLFTISSCTQENIPTNNDKKVLSKKDMEMRHALELSSNILVNMIVNNPNYYDKLNKHIIDGSPNCLDDRVLMKDLFASETKSGAAYMKSNSDFSLDFKQAFARNKPQKMNGFENGNSNLFSDPDSLIQYLEDNNVSLYCPYPLADYDENNQIPAITFHPIDNDSVNIGFLCALSGEISEVSINQAYCDLHPVWILMPNESVMDNNTNTDTPQGIMKAKSDVGYEFTIHKIFCTEYLGGIFDGDLKLDFLRSDDNSYTFNSQNSTFQGSFYVTRYYLPRKYVGYAKQTRLDGWYPIQHVWDPDWDTANLSQAFVLYEWDNVSEKTVTAGAKYKLNDVDYTGTVSKKYSSANELITASEWTRNWAFDIVQNGNPNWKWTHPTWGDFYQIDGKYIFKINNFFMLTASIRTY